MLKVIALSDLHGNFPIIEESADIAIIAGDIIPLQYQTNMPLSENWLTGVFADWCANLKVEKVFLVAGNHDFWFEKYGEDRLKVFDVLIGPSNFSIEYLHNSESKWFDSDGNTIRIFGTPYCSMFGNWAFMHPGDVLKDKFAEIPEGVDILISHNPPYGYCDVVEDKPKQGHVGSVALSQRLHEMETPPKFVFCGHIHTGSHKWQTNGKTKFINVSILNERYKETYKPFNDELDISNL